MNHHHLQHPIRVKTLIKHAETMMALKLTGLSFFPLQILAKKQFATDTTNLLRLLIIPHLLQKFSFPCVIIEDA
jgi:hypothetical protein